MCLYLGTKVQGHNLVISNHTMKPGPLIKYNKRNIFHQKLYIKCGGEASRRPFDK